MWLCPSLSSPSSSRRSAQTAPMSGWESVSAKNRSEFALVNEWASGISWVACLSAPAVNLAATPPALCGALQIEQGVPDEYATAGSYSGLTGGRPARFLGLTRRALSPRVA
jgi:hypothetical protein